MGLAFYVLDTETTGIDSKRQEITEISIIRCADRVQLTEMVKCESPETASIDALRITNKTFADLLKGKSKEEAVERVDKFLNSDGLTPAHRVIVAHNWSFDYRFMCALYDKVGKKFQADLWACSMAMTKAYAKQIGLVKPKVNLDAACKLAGIVKVAGQHASKADTRNTYLLWNDLVNNKQMDYMQFIKNSPHKTKEPDPEFEPDMSIFDGMGSGDEPPEEEDF